MAFFSMLLPLGGLLGLGFGLMGQREQNKIARRQEAFQRDLVRQQQAEAARKAREAEGLTVTPIGRQVVRFPMGLAFGRGV